MTDIPVITLGREFGSGGAEIARLLSDHLGIAYYDKELLTVAAQQSGLSKELFEAHDEKPTNALSYALSLEAFGGMLPIDHNLFLAQFEAIQSLAAQGPCIIVGRCGDYALHDHPNCVNLFVHAPLARRLARIQALYHLDSKRAGELIKKTDKERANYYNFYSPYKWGLATHYHLALDSSVLGVEGSAALIEQFIERRLQG